MKSVVSLFICNQKFLDAASPEGGVKFCTDEYINMLSVGYHIIPFAVQYRTNVAYKVRRKLGVGIYDDYDVHQYLPALQAIIQQQQVSVVFLNLTNTAPFASLIKTYLPHIKIVLCSHGNESGDFLHAIEKHQQYKGFKKRLAAYALGKMLCKEAHFRKYIDLVLTVSDVEVGIEKWIGAPHVLLVPRQIASQQIALQPTLGKVGFLADLSHEPNFFGIMQVCEAIQKLETINIEISIVGNGSDRGQALTQAFQFVTYKGYLDDASLQKELSSWTFALNPVWYYSRGVSTKLGKALGMGMPVITSAIGNRGYIWQQGTIPVADSPAAMAHLITSLSVDAAAVAHYQQQVLLIQQSAPDFASICKQIQGLL